jgi:hypothetical protein
MLWREATGRGGGSRTCMVVDDVEYVLVTKLSFLFLLFTTTCFSVFHN